MTNLSTLPGFGTGSGGGGGGGGGSSTEPPIGTVVDSLTVRCGSASTSRSPNGYTSGHAPAACPSGNLKARDTFFYWAQWADGPSYQTGFTVSSYRVNRSTGALSQLQGGHQDVWTNTSGAAISTTYIAYEPVHGNWFSGTHSAFPGYSSHTFGYTVGRVDQNGLLSNSNYSASNADHGFNGTYCACLPQGTSTQYYQTSGYQSSYAGGRLITASSGNQSIGSFNQYGSWTSSSNLYNHIYQPDQPDVAAGNVTSMNGTSFNTSNYGIKVYRDSSAAQFDNITTGYQKGVCFAGYNGITVGVSDNNSFYGTLGVNSNSFSSLADGERDLGSHSSCSSYVQDIVGIGNNRFLFFNVDNYEGSKVDLVDFDSNNNPRHIQRFTLGSAEDSVLDASGSYCSFFVVFENNTDQYPKWIVKGQSSSNGTQIVQCYEITADLSSYNP
tara:strand:- start:847 stop:2169 length:1323 start_codon:yes stop_codon:yes gene_type:complete